jgi:hypothetical protein
LNQIVEIDLSDIVSQKLSIERTRVLPEILLQFSMYSAVDIVSDIAFIKGCIGACSGTPGYTSKATHDIVCEELEVAYTMGDSIPDVHEIVADPLEPEGDQELQT